MTERAWNSSGMPMLPVDGFRQQLREVWRDHTLGEITAATGIPPTTLRKIMWGESRSIQVRTAVKLKTGLPNLDQP